MKIIALDTETTGLEEGTKSIVEFGMKIIESDGDVIDILDDCLVMASKPVIYEKRFNPREPISFGAMGVHHITKTDVADCDDISVEAAVISMHLDHADFVMGHNLKFDMEVIEREILGGPYDPEKQIDTLRLAKHAWDDLPEYKLASLRYRFNLPISDTGSQHSALFDAGLTMGLAVEAAQILGINSWPDLYSKSISPIILKLMPFGKYRGDILADTFEQNKDYFRWLWRQPWFEGDYPDLAYTLRVLGGKQKQK